MVFKTHKHRSKTLNKLLVIGHWALGIGHCALGIAHWSLVSRGGAPVPALFVVISHVLRASPLANVISHQSLVIRNLNKLPTVNYQLSTANCQLPTANCQLPTVH